jgi:hypothetical protein
MTLSGPPLWTTVPDAVGVLPINYPAVFLPVEGFPNLVLNSEHTLSNLAPRDLCRVLCYYLISRLNDASLTEAWESLIGIYKWQAESDATAYVAPDSGSFFRASHVTEIPNQPFSWD